MVCVSNTKLGMIFKRVMLDASGYNLFEKRCKYYEKHRVEFSHKQFCGHKYREYFRRCMLDPDLSIDVSRWIEVWFFDTPLEDIPERFVRSFLRSYLYIVEPRTCAFST